MAEYEYSRRVVFGKAFLYRCYAGVLTAEKEIEMLQYAIDNGLLDEEICGMVIDMRQATFDLQLGDGQKIIDFCLGHELLAPLKYAIIADTPEKMIHPLIGVLYREDARLKPFSTEHAAIHWLIT